MTAEGLASTMYTKVVPWLGMPENLVSDRGSLFTSAFWASFCFYLAVRRRLSTAYHPQTDGQTERQNQSIEYYLRSYVSWHQDDWTRWIPLAQFVYNTTMHSATGTSPSEALMGIRPELRSSVEDADKEVHLDAKARTTELAERREELSEKLQRTKETMKRAADKNRMEKSFSVTDWVLLRNTHIDSGRPFKKLENRYEGPFQIIRKVGQQAYQLLLTPLYRQIHATQHVSMLEPYKGNPMRDERPDPVEVDGELEFKIDRILETRKKGRGLQYLVRWQGYGDSENTWEPRSILEDTVALEEFEKNRPTEKENLTKRARKNPRQTAQHDLQREDNALPIP